MQADKEAVIVQVQNLVDQIEEERHRHLASDLKARRAQAGLEDDETFSLAEYHVIASIGEAGSTNAVSVANKLRLTRGGVSKIMARLVMRGCVEAHSAADNKREKRYLLTERGRKVFRMHADLHEQTVQSLAAMLDGYAPAELAIVSRFLKDLKKLV